MKPETPSKRFHRRTPPPATLVPLPFQGRLYSGSPLGHPKGVPCAELSPQVTEGISVKPETPSKRFHRRTPPPATLVPLPFQGRLYSGSPLGHPKGVPCAELSPQVTEGYFREASHNKQKIPQKNPSTSYAGPPPLSGEALIRFPERAPEGRALC